VLKSSILLNSLVTMIMMAVNFAFKIYLAREFSQENLVVYYTITDVFSVIGRVFVGYKDALTTLYHQTRHKLKVLRTWSVFFTWMIAGVSFLVIPLVFNFYLVEKINNLQISWWHMTLLFITMNFVAFYGFLFLVTKHYKLISVNDLLKTISYIGMVFFLYQVMGMHADYHTLVMASILSNILVLGYLLYKQQTCLPQYRPERLFGLKFASFKDETNRKFIAQTLMASMNYFLYGLLLFAPVYTMLHDASMEEVAQFQVVARSIYFALIAIFSWPLGRFVFPEFSSLLGQKKYDVLWLYKQKFIKFLGLFSIVVVLGCWLSSKWVVMYLFPSVYTDSYMMLNILIVTLPFVMYQNISESILKATGKYTKLLVIKGTGMIAYIIGYAGLHAFITPAKAALYAFVLAIISITLMSLHQENAVLCLHHEKEKR